MLTAVGSSARDRVGLRLEQGITRSSWQIVRAMGEGTKPQPCAFGGFYGVINGGFTWEGFAEITPKARM